MRAWLQDQRERGHPEALPARSVFRRSLGPEGGRDAQCRESVLSAPGPSPYNMSSPGVGVPVGLQAWAPPPGLEAVPKGQNGWGWAGWGWEQTFLTLLDAPLG